MNTIRFALKGYYTNTNFRISTCNTCENHVLFFLCMCFNLFFIYHIKSEWNTQRLVVCNKTKWLKKIQCSRSVMDFLCCSQRHKALTFMMVSKVQLPVLLVVVPGFREVVCMLLFCWRRLAFFVFLWQQDDSWGQVFLKTLTMRIFIGNMMRELWTPTMNCCQVNSKWPENIALMRWVCLIRFSFVSWGIVKCK